jgi:hypothetical protein
MSGRKPLNEVGRCPPPPPPIFFDFLGGVFVRFSTREESSTVDTKTPQKAFEKKPMSEAVCQKSWGGKQVLSFSPSYFYHVFLPFLCTRGFFSFLNAPSEISPTHGTYALLTTEH